MQKQMTERNAGVPEARRLLYRIGVNLGDVLIDGEDFLGDGVNIAARLEGIAEPGGVCISGSAYDHVRGKTGADFVDLGEKTLKNIAQPVRVYALRVGDVAGANPSMPPRPANPAKPTVPALSGIVALLIVIAAGAGYWFITTRPAALAGALAPVASNLSAPAEAAHLSIVVLPFTNLSGDPAQDYFAGGVTENLTTELSRIHNSFVIARNAG
jgi:adenylate cyclase